MQITPIGSMRLPRKLLLSLSCCLVMAGGFLLFHQEAIKPLTVPLHKQLDSALTETALTFATTRAANAVISLVQESTFGFSLGVQVSIAAGQILDPLNDLIERFSQLTLACLVALSLQKVLLELGIVIAITLLFPLSALIGLIAIWWPGPKRILAERLFKQISIISLFVLLALPASILATHTLNRFLLANQIAAANTRVSTISTELSEQAPLTPTLKSAQGAETATSEPTFLERLRRGSAQAQAQAEQPAKVLALLEQIKALDTDTLIEDIILLCGLYLLRALLLPILMLWLTYKIGGVLLSLFGPIRPVLGN